MCLFIEAIPKFLFRTPPPCPPLIYSSATVWDDGTHLQISKSGQGRGWRVANLRFWCSKVFSPRCKLRLWFLASSPYCDSEKLSWDAGWVLGLRAFHDTRISNMCTYHGKTNWAHSLGKNSKILERMFLLSWTLCFTIYLMVSYVPTIPNTSVV